MGLAKHYSVLCKPTHPLYSTVAVLSQGQTLLSTVAAQHSRMVVGTAAMVPPTATVAAVQPDPAAKLMLMAHHVLQALTQAQATVAEHRKHCMLGVLWSALLMTSRQLR